MIFIKSNVPAEHPRLLKRFLLAQTAWAAGKPLNETADQMPSHGVDRGRFMAFRPHRRLVAGRLRVAQVLGRTGGRGAAEGEKDTARR